MRVAALDLSKSNTGWAIDGDDGLPRAGSWSGARGKSAGRAGSLFSKWLCLMIPVWKPDLIAVEAPLVGGGRSDGVHHGMNVTYPLIGLAFLTETIADSYKIRSVLGNVQTVRRHFIGNGHAPDPKAAVMQRCRMFGWPAENYDESDSMALWAWAKATHDKSFRYETATPLFARAGAGR